MAKAVLARIRDMLETIDELDRASAGKTFEHFQQDWLLWKTAERGIEIISEAGRHLPDELKRSHGIPIRDGVTSLASAMSFVMNTIMSTTRSCGR
jgi:uncharacterized protein with HEPN domain